MSYTIRTLPNGHRFARLPTGELIPNQGRFPARILTDDEIATNFADWVDNTKRNAVEFQARADSLRAIGNTTEADDYEHQARAAYRLLPEGSFQ